MRVLTANAADGSSYLSDGFIELPRKRQEFAGAVIENGCQLSPEGVMLCLPKIEGKHTIFLEKAVLKRYQGVRARE